MSYEYQVCSFHTSSFISHFVTISLKEYPKFEVGTTEIILSDKINPESPSVINIGLRRPQLHFQCLIIETQTYCAVLNTSSRYNMNSPSERGEHLKDHANFIYLNVVKIKSAKYVFKNASWIF